MHCFTPLLLLAALGAYVGLAADTMPPGKGVGKILLGTKWHYCGPEPRYIPSKSYCGDKPITCSPLRDETNSALRGLSESAVGYMSAPRMRLCRFWLDDRQGSCKASEITNPAHGHNDNEDGSACFFSFVNNGQTATNYRAADAGYTAEALMDHCDRQAPGRWKTASCTNDVGGTTITFTVGSGKTPDSQLCTSNSRAPGKLATIGYKCL